MVSIETWFLDAILLFWLGYLGAFFQRWLEIVLPVPMRKAYALPPVLAPLELKLETILSITWLQYYDESNEELFILCFSIIQSISNEYFSQESRHIFLVRWNWLIIIKPTSYTYKVMNTRDIFLFDVQDIQQKSQKSLIKGFACSF